MGQPFDGHEILLRFDDEGEWLAIVKAHPNISAFGDTPEKALAELREAYLLVKEVYEEEGRQL